MINVENSNAKTINFFLPKNKAYFTLMIIFALGLLLRVYDLGSKSFWADEILSIRASERIVDVKSIFSPDPENAHPPLYFLTLKFWSSLGDGEFYLRLWSVLFGLLSIPTTFLLAKQYFNLKTSIMAAFLVSISPCLLRFEREVRMYPLFMLLTIISILLLIKALKNDNNYNWIGYVLFMTLNLYTHYHSFLVLASSWLFYFLSINKNSFWIKPLISQVIIVILYSFWIPAFVHHLLQFSALAGEATRFPSVFGLWIKPAYLFFSFSLGQTILPWNYQIVIPGLILFIALLFLGFLSAYKKNIRNFFISFLLFPILVALFISDLMPRYLIFICPIFYIVIAEGINRIKIIQYQLVIILFLTFILAISLKNYYQNKDFHILANVTPWRDVGNYINNNFKKDDILINIGGGPSIKYYTGLNAPTLGLNAINKIKELDNISLKNIWVVVSNPAYKEAAVAVLSWMDLNYDLISVKKYYRDDDFNRKAKFFKKNFLEYRVKVYEFRKKKDLSNLMSG